MLERSKADWLTIYQCLIHAIKTNSGIGFHNRDQGHPTYSGGAEDGTRDDADSPEQNRLYQMLVALNEKYGQQSGTPVRNWREFCQLALDGYKRYPDGTP